MRRINFHDGYFKTWTSKQVEQSYPMFYSDFVRMLHDDYGAEFNRDEQGLYIEFKHDQKAVEFVLRYG